MSLLGPFWTPFWSRFGSQVRYYTIFLVALVAETGSLKTVINKYAQKVMRWLQRSRMNGAGRPYNTTIKQYITV